MAAHQLPICLVLLCLFWCLSGTMFGETLEFGQVELRWLLAARLRNSRRMLALKSHNP